MVGILDHRDLVGMMEDHGARQRTQDLFQPLEEIAKRVRGQRL
jgi:hypothetical protein